jgi:hypothetical protein
MKTEILNLPSITALVAAANTPAFVYKRLRRDRSVERFSSTGSVAELLSLVEETSRKAGRAFEDVVLAYCALVAATFKPTEEIREYIKERGFPRFQWAQDILERHLLSTPATKLIVVEFGHSAKVSPPGVAVSSTSSSTAHQVGQPMISTPAISTSTSTTPRNNIIWDGGHND